MVQRGSPSPPKLGRAALWGLIQGKWWRCQSSWHGPAHLSWSLCPWGFDQTLGVPLTAPLFGKTKAASRYMGKGLMGTQNTEHLVSASYHMDLIKAGSGFTIWQWWGHESPIPHPDIHFIPDSSVNRQACSTHPDISWKWDPTTLIKVGWWIKHFRKWNVV